MPSSSFLIRDPNLRLEIPKHPDNYIIDQESGYGIEQIRQLVGWVSHKPFERKYKLVFIRDAEQLTAESQNALLKTLEEPPGQTFFLLTYRNIEQLLTTVRSRCQNIELSHIPQLDQSQHPWIDNVHLAKTTTNHSGNTFPKPSSVTEALETSTTLAKHSRQKLVAYLDNWIQFLYQQDLTQYYWEIDQLIETRQRIDANTNKQLALDVLLTGLARRNPN